MVSPRTQERFEEDNEKGWTGGVDTEHLLGKPEA